MNAVYWITGLSGAGKTTIGKIFYEKLRKKRPNTVFLDGDAMRKVFGDDLGYAREERIKCAMRYARLCDMLQKQEMNVVCCTISMFDCVRDWNREHIKGYREIFVKASMETLFQRDQKGLYSGKGNGGCRRSYRGGRAQTSGLDIAERRRKNTGRTGGKTVFGTGCINKINQEDKK